MTGITNNIVNAVRMQRLKWYGNVCRLPDESLVKRTMKYDFKDKRPK